MNAYATIRAALEMSKHASRYCVLPWLERKTDEALAALAELERSASEPVAWRYRYSDGKHSSAWLTNNNPPPKWDAAVADVVMLYAAPPVPAGMFTAEEMAESWICGNRDNCRLEESDIFKLIQERAK